MKSSNNFLVTFYSTHQALKTEKTLKQYSLAVDLIPTPRNISSECGFSLLLKEAPTAPSEHLRRKDYENIYRITEDLKGDRFYEKAD